MAFTYRFPRPAVTVDVVLFAAGPRGDLRVLLIQRDRAPFAGTWALPGGFLDLDEELEAAARRELVEETGLRAGRLAPLGTYGTLGRDPRGRTISVVFLTCGDVAAMAPQAGDDARASAWCSATRPPALAFDHAQVLRDARARLSELAKSPAAWTAAFGRDSAAAVLRRSLRKRRRA